MIRYIKNKDIDFNKWDDCILSSPNGLVYAFSWYLNIVAGEWNALVEDDYDFVFPLFPRKKFGIVYSLQPKWTQQLGLFSKKLLTTEKSMEFLNAAVSKVMWFDMNLNSIQKLPEPNKFKIIKNNNYILNLIEPYEHIYKRYSENLKRNLAKNSKGLNVIPLVSHQEIIDMFRNTKGKSIKVLGDAAYKKFTHLIYYARSINAANVLGVIDERNTVLGGAIFLLTKGRATLIFSANSEEGRNRSAMHVLIDSFIKNNEQQNMILDFEGSNDKNLARFYKSFGAQCHHYLRVKYNRLPIPMCIVDNIRYIIPRT